MAVTVLTSAILKDYLQQTGTSVQLAVTDAMITRAVNAANDTLTEWGVPDSATGAAAVHAAALLGMVAILDSEMLKAALRNDTQSRIDAIRRASSNIYLDAVKQAAVYLSPSLRRTTIATNRSWAYARGGPLDKGSEAGTYRRSTP